MSHFDRGYVTCLYVPFYLGCDVCAQILAILLVYISILACYSAPCIFEKHMLAFEDLIHALPTGGSTQFMFPGGALHQEKNWEINWEKCICSVGLAFMHLGDLFCLNVSCALLPMVSSSFASP
jgi:hypothetical protein